MLLSKSPGQSVATPGIPRVQRSWCHWGIRLVVTTGMLIWVLQQLNVQAFQSALLVPALLPLLAMVGAAWIFVLLGGLKFWVLSKALTPIPFVAFLRHFLVATAFGAFTPASLGDFSLAALLRRKQIPVHESLSVILVDRAVTMGMYALVFVPLTFGMLLHTVQLWWIPASVLGSALVLLAMHSMVDCRQIVRRLLTYCPWPCVGDCLVTTSTLVRQHPWYLAGNVGLTFLRCLVSGGVVLCALWATGEAPPWWPVLATTNTIAILNLLPVSLAGLGVYESGGVVLLGRMGIQQEYVFAALIYQRAYVLLSSLLILIVACLSTGTLRRLSGRLRKQ